MKAYSAKSSAVRAAKQAFGAAWEEKAAVLPATAEQGQGWVIIERQPAKPAQEVATSPAPTALIHPMRRASDREAPWNRLLSSDSLKADIIHKLEEVIEEVKELPAHVSLAEALAASGESIEDLTADEDQAAADAQANRLALGWKLSSVEKPTKKVWVIASDMPGASRKEVIEACIKAGIGAGTARTQYQAWFTAMKASQPRPEQA